MEDSIVKLKVHFGGSWRLNHNTMKQKYIDGRQATRIYDSDTLCFIDLSNEIAEVVHWGEDEVLSLSYEMVTSIGSELKPLTCDKDLLQMFKDCKGQDIIPVYAIVEIFTGISSFNVGYGVEDATLDEQEKPAAAITGKEEVTQGTRRKTKRVVRKPIFVTNDNKKDAFEVDTSEEESESEKEDCNEPDVGYEISSEDSYHSLDSSNSDCSEYEEETFELNVEEPAMVVGALFDDIQKFRDALRDHAVKNHFGCKFIHNEKRRVTVKCYQPECSWRLHASRLQDKTTFQVKSIKGDHKCEAVNLLGNNMATSSWICSRIVDWIKVEPKLTVKAIQLRLKKSYSVELKYHKVYRAKEDAYVKIYGKAEDTFKMIPSLWRELTHRNPDSIIRYTVDIDNTFQRFFVCFGANINGFKKGCRPLLGLDGCHLKSKFQGTLLTASTLDGNFGLFPVAYAIVENECGNSWKWFIECLLEGIGVIPDLTIMSDRDKGLLEAVRVLLPNAEHRYCTRHFYKNFKKRFPGLVLERDIWKAARSYTNAGYEENLNNLKTHSEPGHAWILSQNTKAWSRASFGEKAKCHYITNNVSESFNNFIGEDRCRAFVDLIDHLRQKIMVRMDHRRRLANRWKGRLTPRVSKYVSWISKDAGTAGNVFRCADEEAEVDDGSVRATVNLEKKICSCRMWQVSGLPCKHAAATILAFRRRIELYVDDYFLVDRYKLAYASNIAPMPDKSLWMPPHQIVKPPKGFRKKGRPKKKRIKVADEIRSSSGVQKSFKTCTLCGNRGHNKRRCTGPPKSTEQSESVSEASSSHVTTTRGGTCVRGRGTGRGRGRGRSYASQRGVMAFVRSTQ